jgi:hypothetical protein
MPEKIFEALSEFLKDKIELSTRAGEIINRLIKSCPIDCACQFKVSSA